MLANKIINKILKLDPESAVKLQILQDKYLLLNITNINLKLYFTYQANNLIISSVASNNNFPVTSITGTITAFIRQDHGELLINGDPLLAQQIQSILQNTDLDFEAALAEYTGDVIAYQIGSFFKKQQQLFKHMAESLQESAKDYLHEEAQLFPNKLPVQEFMNEVDKLVADVERFEARLEKCAAAI
ncbi:MAG: hypothetical protein COC15_00300 [Legionellales bacterium]|nr:MAG: hypothetical protein COC15_00300 [Legionellales bacterium]